MAQATAKTTTRTVERTITETVEEPTGEVTLVLSKNEAESLAEVFYLVGGSPHTTRRGHVQAVAAALKAAGVVNPAELVGPFAERPATKTSSGLITFAPIDDPAVLEGLPLDPSADLD